MKDLLHKLFSNYEVKKEDLEKVKELVADYYKIPKSFLDRVKVSYSNLPVIYSVYLKRFGDYIILIYKPIAKVFGLYNPSTKEISIDYKLSYSKKIKTLIHEYVHAAQDYLGKIYKLSKEKIEEEAEKISDYLFRIYNQAFQRSLSSLSYLVPI